MPAFAGMTALCMLATPALADDMKMPRMITVSGQAERNVVPDEAHITVNLNSMDVKLAAAKTAHDAKLKKLMSIAKSKGVAEKKISSQSSSIQPNYDYVSDPKTGAGRQIFKGYRVQTNIDITVTDMSKIGELMDEISGAGFEKGANTEWGQLMSMNYAIADPDKIRDEMLVEAITNARTKAERMVKAAGASIGRVYSINESGVSMPPPMMPMPMMARAMMADAAGASSPVAPPAGEQQINANVTISFELKD
jgi:hypothetical protein